MAFCDQHAVTYEHSPGERHTITREVFDTPDGRLLGTEITCTEVYRGYDGWRKTWSAPTTAQFRTMDELREWVDDLYRAHDVWKVAQSGGTKLVIV